MDTVLEFHAKAPQATASEELAQGPYVAARAGFEPTTLWSTGIDSTNEPKRPTLTGNPTFTFARFLTGAISMFT